MTDNIEEILDQVFLPQFKDHLYTLLKGKRECKLFEENNNGNIHTKPYEININIPEDMENDDLILFKNIEQFKSEIKLFNQESPKDCDYILVNLSKKSAYLFELKDTSTSFKHIVHQLLAGKQWLSFFLFLLDGDEETPIQAKNNLLNNWNLTYTHAKYSPRPQLTGRNSSSYPTNLFENSILINKTRSSSIQLNHLTQVNK